MDFQRSDPHFKLSPDPRQPQAADAPIEQVAVVSTQEVEPEVHDIEFEPAPPTVPDVAPPVIESMQAVTPEPAPEPEPVAQVAPESHVLPHKSSPPRNGVPTKFVVAGGLVLLALLIGSVVWQQMAISELKNERKVLGEQVKAVNPISVGGGQNKSADEPSVAE